VPSPDGSCPLADKAGRPISETMMSEKWKHAPLEVVDGIPIFTRIDRYVANYQKIATDHLDSMKPGAANPWIPDALWNELEDSTASLIRKYARPGDKVLDVGVGLGRILCRFPDLDRSGIDISMDYLRIAQEAGIDVAFSRIEDCPYHDAAFDVVICCDVLEHVLDLNRCCEQLLRVLKPGGILIVRVPNEEDIEVYLRDDLPYYYIHLRRFDLPSLRLLFSKVFSCEFLESKPVGLHLQGAPRLRLRLLQQARLAPLGLSDAVEEDHPLFLLKRAAEVSEEQVVNWIYDLRDRHPEEYNSLAPELIIPIEVNAVFRSPL
jgi:SAM-dependent methyltransferase